MCKQVTYIKNGKEKFFYEKGFYYFRPLLVYLEIKLNSNIYLAFRQFFSDRNLSCIYKSRDTIAKEIGPIAGRTVGQILKIFLKKGLLQTSFLSTGQKGYRLNEKKINEMLPKLKKNYPITYIKKKKEFYKVEAIFTYEKEELNQLLKEKNIDCRPAHLDVYTFLASHNYSSFNISSRKMAKKMFTVSHRTIDKVKKDFKKIGILKSSRHKKSQFTFTRLNRKPKKIKILTKISTFFNKIVGKSCIKMGKFCQNSGKILPHKSINILILQEEKKIIQISTSSEPIKNISQCYNFLQKHDIPKNQVQCNIIPKAKIFSEDPILYLNFKINQFEYIKKHHQWRIWENNDAMFLNNIITKNWNFDEYIKHLAKIKPPDKPHEDKRKEIVLENRKSQLSSKETIIQLKNNNNSVIFAQNLNNFLKNAG